MELVTIVNGEAVAYSTVIAEGTENEHASVVRLVRTYQSDLEEFGRVGFEIEPFETPGGQQQREVALLNEQQTTLILTYLRNNEIVRGFKKRLVRRFFELRDGGVAHKLPQTFAQALMLAAQQAVQIEQQQAQIEAAKPAVEFVDRFVAAEGLKGFREVCKLLKANEDRFKEFLLDRKIMYRLGGKLTAFQYHIDAGRFEVRAGVAKANERAFTSTKFTSKGIEWVAGEWAKQNVRDAVAA